MLRALLYGSGLAVAVSLLLSAGTLAGEFGVSAEPKLEMKAVFGRVESRDTVEARARIGGTILSLQVEEGSAVASGDVIALVVDDKLALQVDAVDARLKAVKAELANALTELTRAKSLLASGVVPKSRVDTLQTQFDVLTNQMNAFEAERAVLVQQGTEGQVKAPAPGRVLAVPVTRGSVVLPGETVARIAGGGYFLRLSLPERHASRIVEGGTVRVGSRGLSPSNVADGARRDGRIVKVYPEIEGGRVLADVEVDGLGDFFVGERTLVWVPVDRRDAIAVPPDAITTRFGIDYVKVRSAGGGSLDVAVIAGDRYLTEKGPRVEILSGLAEGDTVLLP